MGPDIAEALQIMTNINIKVPNPPGPNATPPQTKNDIHVERAM